MAAFSEAAHKAPEFRRNYDATFVRVETDEQANERLARDGVEWVSYEFAVGRKPTVAYSDGRRELLGGGDGPFSDYGEYQRAMLALIADGVRLPDGIQPRADGATTLPDMVPAAVLARRPPAPDRPRRPLDSRRRADGLHRAAHMSNVTRQPDFAEDGGYEMQCTECDTWTRESSWDEGEVGCEDCGDHGAAKCPHCGACFDSTIPSWGVGNLPHRRAAEYAHLDATKPA